MSENLQIFFNLDMYVMENIGSKRYLGVIMMFSTGGECVRMSVVICMTSRALSPSTPVSVSKCVKLIKLMYC